MIWELVYTSLEHGLKGGKSGFGIAAATVGIPEVIARMLCTGSGYTPFYPPHTPEYNSNPVSDFHSIARIGDTAWHWVGRIKACGMDYSGRSNLLAHHLLFTQDEIAGALPETLLDDCAALGLIELDTFTGPARWLEPLKSLPPGRNAAGGGAWREAVGDPGWAGVPAECAAAGRAPVYIAVKPDADVRAMLRESMRLLPPEMRWRVTYNTYYTRASGDVRCDWRFCMEGDRLLTAARRQPGITVIDGNSPPPVTAWTRFAVGAGPSPAGASPGVFAEMDDADPIPLKPSRSGTAGIGTPPRAVADAPVPEASFREIGRSRRTLAWAAAALLILAAGVWAWLGKPPEGLFDVPDFEGTAEEKEIRESAVSVPVTAVDFPLPDGEGEGGDGLPRERFKDLPGAAAAAADGTGENADEGTASRGRGKIIISSRQEETPPDEPAAAPPVLPPSPEVLQELPGRIWRLCAVGGPGESEGLGSALAPEVKLLPGAALNRLKDGSMTVTAAAGELCTFRATDEGSGEWRLEVSGNFLPGLSGFSGISWHADTAARPVTMNFNGCMLSEPGRLEYDRDGAAGLVWMDDVRLAGVLESSGVLADNGLELFSGGLVRRDPELAARLVRCRAGLEEYERNFIAETRDEIARLTAGAAEISALRDSYLAERMEDLAELESQRPPEMVRPSGNPPDEIRRRWFIYEKQLKAWNKKYDDFNRETEKALAAFDENLSRWQSALTAACARAEEIVYSEELRNEAALINSELDRKAALWEGMESLRIVVAEGVSVEIVSGRDQ